MKKPVLLALAAVFLLAAGCSNPIVSENKPAPQNGAGTVLVNLGGVNPRTLLPGAAGLYYTLSFKDAGNTVVKSTVIASGTTASVELPVGTPTITYSLSVKGFLTKTDAEAPPPVTPVVEGSADTITVTANGVTPVTVPLKPTTPIGGSGTLTYHYSFPGVVTQATLDIASISGTPVTTINLRSSGTGGTPPWSNTYTTTESRAEGTVTLASGYYNIRATIRRTGDKPFAVWSDTAHIYSRLTTAASYDFAEKDFMAVNQSALADKINEANVALEGVEVDADGSNVPVGTEWVTQAVWDAFTDAITDAQGVPANATQADIDAAASALDAAIVAFKAKKADGTKGASGNAAITIAFNDLGNGLVSQSSFKLSQTTTTTIDLVTPALTGETVQWLVDGNQKSVDPGTNSFTLEGSTLGEGGHTLTVRLTKNNVPWTQNLPFTIVKNLVTITAADLDKMQSLITAVAAEGGGTSRADPIVVAITIADADLLEDSGDTLRKLFNAIPSGKYVSYDLSDCTFTGIGDSDMAAFRPNTANIVSITLPKTLTSIGNNAFYGCNGLTSVSIPSSVTAIGNSAFSNCSGLTSVDIGNSVTTISCSAFSGCTQLSEIKVNASNTAYTAIAGVLFNKSSTTLITYPRGKTESSYVIPNSVTTIGDSAFSGSGLTSVTIPSNVTTIGSSAFSGSGLTSVTIPGSVTSIGSSAFSGSGLTSVSISSGVTAIGSSAFSGCSVLTSVTIPGSVTTIGSSAFYNCSGLKSVIITSGVTTIGSSAFSGCSVLTPVTIPDSVTSIGSSAFYNCSGLTSVSIGSGVTSIGSSAFSGCTNLTAITVTTGNTAYKDIAGILFNNSGTTLIIYPRGKTGNTYTIPDDVTAIGNDAFANCNGLTSVTIPVSVTTIGNSAFSGSGLTAVTIPVNVTAIGSSAFSNCSSLSLVNVQRSTYPLTTLGGSAFSNTSATLVIKVPASIDLQAYKTMSGWSDYASKIQSAS